MPLLGRPKVPLEQLVIRAEHADAANGPPEGVKVLLSQAIEKRELLPAVLRVHMTDHHLSRT